jgi:hypothetical protein
MSLWDISNTIDDIFIFVDGIFDIMNFILPELEIYLYYLESGKISRFCLFNYFYIVKINTWPLRYVRV